MGLCGLKLTAPQRDRSSPYPWMSWGWVAEVLLAGRRRRVGGWGFVQPRRASLGQMALFRLGSGSRVSFLEIVVVVGGVWQPLFTVGARRWKSVSCVVCHRAPDGGPDRLPVSLSGRGFSGNASVEDFVDARESEKKKGPLNSQSPSNPRGKRDETGYRLDQLTTLPPA